MLNGKSRALMREAEQRNRNQAMDEIRKANGHVPRETRQQRRLKNRKYFKSMSVSAAEAGRRVMAE